jgi:hypothetical protein
VQSSNLSRDIGYPDSGLRGSRQSLKADAGILFGVGHDGFIPNLLISIIKNQPTVYGIRPQLELLTLS